MNDTKMLNRVFGLVVLLVTLAVYSLTVQQSVPFWDCGEFSAAAVWQQVPHPPGAPLFLMLGKLFHMLIPFGDPGWKINMLSAVATALTSWLLYYIIVMTINNFRGKEYKSLGEAIAVYSGGLVGGLAYSFSDTVWFNGVESEVYAMANLFVAVVVYLMMKWNEEADNPGHERYLLMIAYIIGLSTGVHLLAILAIFSIVYLVYFRKYKFSIPGFFITGAISVVIFGVIYPGVVKWIPALLAGHTAGRNETFEYAIENSVFLQVLAIGIIIAAFVGYWYANKTKNSILKLVTASFVLVLLGYTTYTQILIRSNANPPMNENEPKNFTKLASYLGREQYGDDKSWPRRIKNEDYFIRNYNKKDDNGNFVYGEWYPPGRKVVTKKDGSQYQVPHFDRINTAGEINYLMKYQIYHMYIRYFNWNYIGRLSDEQDADYAFIQGNDELNYKSGFADDFPIRFFALPFFLGLIGFFFHFQKDRKMAFIFLTMFLMMGVLAAIAQQQQEPQPRERDYFYTGSFLVWCMWIGIGVYALIEQLSKEKFNVGISSGIAVVCLVAVPLNMAIGGWRIHDRTGNFLPFDYSYNILQSSEEDAIIFTNGDNDTFPLWYIQDVMGVRRDVRIVNLSLGNTLWYVRQLKHEEPWGAKKIPLTFSDASIMAKDEGADEALSYDFGMAYNLKIPVRKEILAKYTDDQAIIEKGMFETQFVGKSYGEQDGKQMYLFRVQDKLVRDILEQTRFERPVYFSTTVGPDAWCGLDQYFRFEGMIMRVCPTPQRSFVGESIEYDITEKCLMNIDNSADYSTTPKYGFKFRNLSNMDVYYDPVHTRLIPSYRQLYMSFAQGLVKVKNDKAKAKKALDLMNENLSYEQFPMQYDIEYKVMELYEGVDDKASADKFAQMALKSCNDIINNNKLKQADVYYEFLGRNMGPYRIAATLYSKMEDYRSAIDVLRKLLVGTQAMASYDGGGENSPVQRSIFDINSQIEEMEILEIAKNSGTKAALDKIEEKMELYFKNPTPQNRYLLQMLNSQREKLNSQLSPSPSDTIVQN